MDYDYDALVALAAVVREGRFDAAAKSLNVTQSAVSQRIKHLEESVGSVLVVRGRPCVPTEAGLQFCRHVEQVSLLQHELSERINAMSGGSDSSEATIRISVNNDSLATWFPSVIKRAAGELKVRFDILPADQEDTEQNLVSGEALAVVTANDQPVQGCRRISLGSMDYFAVSSPEFYNAHFVEGVTLAALAKAPCLAFDRSDTIQDQWMNLCFGEAAKSPTHLVPSYEGYVACCLNGTAWGLVPGMAGLPLIENGQLIELIPDRPVKVALHWKTSTQSSEVLRRLGDIVSEEAMRQLQPDDFRLF
ncbi:LysR family transcriptional regulator ArgP [Tropicimonas marinistellae]|uniref:LysR family transcriptional regulator ArgP n=1 Tax=Tropicimonas marinistellae TaxID=1739787 RepID=UPI0008365DED|nr:LysR family transcriptional regulator ArgP [Tropicimonas marinistellae]